MIEMDTARIRKDFPILEKDVIYFDNACMSLRPRQVISSMNEYYAEYGGCSGRSLHRFGKKTEEKFEEARGKIAKFVGCSGEEVAFTKNTTEAINLIAHSLDFSGRKKVVTSNMEHHSAFLPFLLLSKEGKAELDFVIADEYGETSAEKWKEKIDRNTRLVVAHHTTNSIGTSAPLKEITKIAHDNGALVLVDGAQGVPHFQVDFRKSDFDFLAFSGHKMLGPTGTGCLVAKRHILEEMKPFIVGGDTIEKVTLDSVSFLKPPQKFEGGLQHYAGFIGLGAAVDYLRGIGMENVEKQEKELGKRLIEGLLEIEGVKVYGPTDYRRRCAIAAFNLKKNSPHQVAIMLDTIKGIAVRSGVFCAEPGMTHLGAPDGAVRASLYLYNTKEEVETFLGTLGQISKIL